MKILRLDFRAFGPFTDKILDLAAGDHGIHVIFGANEAGKSSSLRAIDQLLFGIHEQTSDAFVHSYDKLVIGANLRGSDGAELDFTRRKKRKHALLAADGQTTVDEAQLRRMLGNLDRSQFLGMFGLSRDQLKEGGEEILRVDGAAGKALFAAASGITGSRRIQQNIADEYKELFLTGGRNPAINAKLSAWEGKRKELKTLQLSSEEWQKHESALVEAENQGRELQSELDRCETEIHRLNRMKLALPMLGRRDELVKDLAKCMNAVRLRVEFSRLRLAAQQELSEATIQLDQAIVELSRIDDQLAKLNIPTELLAHEDAIQRFYERKSVIDTAAMDRGGIYRSQKNHEHRAHEIWKNLGQTDDLLPQVEKLRLRPGEAESIRSHGANKALLVEKCKRIVDVLAKLAARLENTDADLTRMQPLRNTAELLRVVSTIQKLGPIEDTLATTKKELEVWRHQASQMQQQLRLSGISVDALLSLPMPGLETIEQFKQDFDEQRGDIRKIEDAHDKSESELHQLRDQIRQLELQHNPPSEDELSRARERRDKLWTQVQRAWKQGEAQTVAPELLRDGGTTDLAEGYEQSVLEADTLADRLRHEAERVTRKIDWSVRAEREQANLERLTRDRAEQRERLATLEQRWCENWRPIGLAPLTPKERRPTVELFRKLVERLEQMQIKEADIASQVARIAGHRDKVRACLTELGEPKPGELSLLELVDFSFVLIRNEERLAAEKQELTKERDNDVNTRRALLSDKADADAELHAWQTEWERFMQRLELPADTSPTSASKCLEAIQQMWQELDEAAGDRARVKGIDSDREEFELAVGELQTQLLPESDLEPTPAIALLHSRLQQARLDRHAAESLQKDKLTWQARARDAATRKTTQESVLAVLCQEAGVTTIEELPHAEERSQLRRKLEEELERTDKALQSHRGRVSIEEFQNEAAALDMDQIDTDLTRSEMRKKELEARRTEINQRIGSMRNDFERMDGSGAAAEIAQKLEELSAQIQEDVGEYLTLRVADLILRKGIARYQEKNEGPIFRRAGALFHLLTGKSFTGLQLDHNAVGEPSFAGVRANDASLVPVTAMSDGTRDQLYLALRLASLEVFLETHEPIPFIADDLLLNFDNDRAVAGLQALAELSRRTQVLFFTHHRHLVDLAQTHLPAEVVFVHPL